MKTPCLEPVRAVARPADVPRRLGVSAACLAARMEDRIEAFVCAQAENLGHLESQLAAEAQELLRQAAEQGAQQKAEATPPRCPHCQRALTRQSSGHPRTFAMRFGEVVVRRTRGYCPRCRKWRVPADTALGLAETAGYSPAVQEMTALLASKMPVGEASLVLERLTGVKVPRATLDREARRQGTRAQALRHELAAPRRPPARQFELPLEPYQLVIRLISEGEPSFQSTGNPVVRLLDKPSVAGRVNRCCFAHDPNFPPPPLPTHTWRLLLPER